MRPGLRLAWLAGAGVLCLAVAREALAGLDQGLLDVFAALRGPFLDGVFQAVTWLGSGYVLAPVVVLLVAWQIVGRHGAAAGRLAVVYFGAALTTWGLKLWIGRPRPDLYPALAGFVGPDWSFPSGHTTHAAAFALGLWAWARGTQPTWRRGLAGVLVIWVCLVAASRLYLQVHWPSDVLAGLLVALAWAGLAGARVKAYQGGMA